ADLVTRLECRRVLFRSLPGAELGGRETVGGRSRHRLDGATRPHDPGARGGHESTRNVTAGGGDPPPASLVGLVAGAYPDEADPLGLPAVPDAGDEGRVRTR